jgi:hypothetical protein
LGVEQHASIPKEVDGMRSARSDEKKPPKPPGVKGRFFTRVRASFTTFHLFIGLPSTFHQ